MLTRTRLSKTTTCPFCSTDIESAVMAGEITPTTTDEVYRCSVIGKP